MARQSERLISLMQRLRLLHLPACYEQLADTAAQRDQPYLEFLENVLEAESQAKFERNVRLKTLWANFPFQKRLDQFDFTFQPSLDERKIRELASLRFLEHQENVILLGPPGVGKTHLAIALGLEAILKEQSTYFVTLPDLVAQLAQARHENRLKEKMATFVKKAKLLILDEIGYLPVDSFAATCLFQIVSERYEHGSMVLTSNKSYGDWGEIFHDNALATAVLDRLLHHSHTINIKGDSYRLKEKRKAGLLAKTAAAPSPAIAEEIKGSKETK
jgi:DNA replication protein DnaC